MQFAPTGVDPPQVTAKVSSVAMASRVMPRLGRARQEATTLVLAKTAHEGARQHKGKT
jgi:hypothetical protein